MTISVIIPVYNAGKTLETGVGSVLGQSRLPDEILLVDDGSEDDSIAVAERLQSRDSRVRLLRQPHGGASAARNRGLREAAGEWVLFLDADDRLAENALEVLAAQADAETDACCGRVLRSWEKEEERADPPLRFREGSGAVNWALADPTERLTIHGWLIRRAVCMQAEIFFRPDLRLAEDSEWMLRVLYACRGVQFVSEAVYRYSISAESTIHRWKKGLTDGYLRTLKEIGRTTASGEKNWPLFVLTTLLLILTHDVLHPANPAGMRERTREMKRLRALPEMEEAFRKADLSQLSAGKRLVLLCLKNRCYAPVRLAVRFRQRQNAS